jgi:hypothetical protein
VRQHLFLFFFFRDFFSSLFFFLLCFAELAAWTAVWLIWETALARHRLGWRNSDAALRCVQQLRGRRGAAMGTGRLGFDGGKRERRLRGFLTVSKEAHGDVVA